MKRLCHSLVLALIVVSSLSQIVIAAEMVSVAILKFDEKGVNVREYGTKVSDLLFAKLVAAPEFYLVDREELNKTLAEQELNITGAVKPDEAVKLGQLSGAKILLSGTVLQVDKNIHLVARIVGTETSRLAGASVEGKVSDELGPLVAELATKIQEAIEKQHEKLISKPLNATDRVAKANEKLGDKTRPSVYVTISEKGTKTGDSSAETALIKFAKNTNFNVMNPEPNPMETTVSVDINSQTTQTSNSKVSSTNIDITKSKEPLKTSADIIIQGTAFSEFLHKRGNLISMKSRVEIKAIDRKTDKVLAVDTQSEIELDLAEQVAGKAAIEKATNVICERLLPKLVK